MGRPPRPHLAPTTTGSPPEGLPRLDYLPQDAADFLDHQRAVAEAEVGLVPVQGEGDFAATLMELSASVAQVLAVYQDRQASEAFLGTAQSARSLVKHGRRLAYEPDPGLAATGHVALKVPAGLTGVVPRRFAVSSAPVGEKKAQDYETVEDLPVDWRENELTVLDAREPMLVKTHVVYLAGVGHGIQRGEIVAIVAPKGTPGPALSAHEVSHVRERLDGKTRLWLRARLPPEWHGRPTAGFALFRKPKKTLRLFGWDAPARHFPEISLRLAGKLDESAAPPETGALHGYVVEQPAEKEVESYDPHEVFLSASVGTTDLRNTPVVYSGGERLHAALVTRQREAAVRFEKRWKEKISVEIATKGAGGKETKETRSSTETLSVSISATTTALELHDALGHPLTRNLLHVKATVWLAGWEQKLAFAPEWASGRPVELPVRLAGPAPGLAPGRRVVLAPVWRKAKWMRAPRDPELAEITAVSLDAGGKTLLVWWRIVEPAATQRPWKLGNLRVLGNVARVAHGKSVEEILGESDGTTPFQRFTLGKAPLAWDPGARAAEPALELRVGDVAWTRVDDLAASGPSDRHHLLQRDEVGVPTVLFGDGRHGAVPPAGKRNVTAVYRVGGGAIGNAPEGALTRIKKAHPLVASATSPLPITGGADPAGAAEVRAQATRFIRTFERAVSVQDHADLALLYPGVARARAWWGAVGDDGALGVRVVVADAQGAAPPLPPIAAYLEARRDGAVRLKVTGARPRPVRLEVYVERDPDYLDERVKAAVRAALVGAPGGAAGLLSFGRRALGQPLFLSEVYEAVTAVEGVSYVEVRALDFRRGGTPGLHDVLLAGDDEWLALADADLDLGSPPTGGGA